MAMNGVAGNVFTNERQYPADEYFPKCDKSNKNYYVVKVVRRPLKEMKLLYLIVPATQKGRRTELITIKKYF